MNVIVLRIGHRISRDKRITTHCGLVARAFGADKIIISGDYDKSILESIANISEKWGGNFKAIYAKNWKNVIKDYRKQGFSIIHLTMYGIPVQNKIEEIKNKKLLVAIGGEKVPADLYELSDYNIGITNQPHSEVAALAVFLHEYFEGKELEKKFEGRLRVVPQEKGKCIKEWSPGRESQGSI